MENKIKQIKGTEGKPNYFIEKAEDPTTTSVTNNIINKKDKSGVEYDKDTIKECIKGIDGSGLDENKDAVREVSGR